MFFAFFRTQRQTQTVEVDGGKFEFKALSKDTPLKVLWFTKYDIMQSTVAEAEVRNIAPFRDNGVACEIKWRPNGHQAITIYFFENGELWDEKGFILNKDSLVYMYKDELRIFTKSGGDKLLINKKALKSLGYNGSIILDEDKFCLKNDTIELVPFDFFDYTATPLLLHKKECICREIMLQVRMFITNEFAKNHMGANRSQELSSLTWEAKTATIEDVKRLIALEKDEDNLSQKNTEKMLAVINVFEINKKVDLFTKYIEMFLTAYEQLSKHEEWTRAQWFGKNNLTKELAEHHNTVYQTMNSNMDVLAKELVERSDFLELLKNYKVFENAVREYFGF